MSLLGVTEPFAVVTDESRYFVIAEVDEKTAKRAAALVARGKSSRGDLAAVVADALNLRAMPMLMAEALSG